MYCTVFRNSGWRWRMRTRAEVSCSSPTHAVLGEILKHHKAIVIGNFLTGFCAVGALILFFHLSD